MTTISASGSSRKSNHEMWTYLGTFRRFQHVAAKSYSPFMWVEAGEIDCLDEIFSPAYCQTSGSCQSSNGGNFECVCSLGIGCITG